MRVLRALPFLLALSAALSSCDTEEEECADKICSRSAGSAPEAPLELVISLSGGWDSVWVEIHSGPTVEQGPLHSSWGIRGGGGRSTLRVGTGQWSGHAVYIRPGDTLDTYDSDETDWERKNDKCGCFEEWSADNGELDLREVD